MFVNDYVKTKYKDIYVEAASLYNQLNQNYPRKPDLRKTVEYRRWKNDIAAKNNIPTTPIPRQKTRPYTHMIHPNIQINTTTSPPHITASPPDNTSIDLSTVEISISDETQPPAQNPVPQNPSPAEKQSSDHPLDERLGGMTMRLSIPLIQIPTSSAKTVQHPDQILSTAFQETTIDEGDQAEVLDPSILNDILPETMEKIIQELQSDPSLNNIMAEIENNFNIEEEIVGLTVDLPDLDDPLEDELMFW